MSEKKIVMSLYGPGYSAEGFSDGTSRIFFDEKWLMMPWDMKILDMRRIVIKNYIMALAKSSGLNKWRKHEEILYL